ncbi:hypothetical protein LTR53_016612 [Teratosphaeriaceae sp. CCFEE 6253]|nr:hypothetical protein LTR53_016612 [Teratosphaeriaceae sp. CCFEE 6253]
MIELTAGRLGDRRACAPQNLQPVEYPYGRTPFATFTFKYRSRRDLQIEGVIARSPSPVPLEDRDPDSLTAEEARELVRLMRARRDAQVRVKQEKRARSATVDGGGGEDSVRISSENRTRKRHRASNDSGVEIVDLTEA